MIKCEHTEWRLLTDDLEMCKSCHFVRPQSLQAMIEAHRQELKDRFSSGSPRARMRQEEQER